MKKIDSTNLSTLDVTATVRPTRIAFLLDDQTKLSWVSEKLIPWISSTWGGASTFFMTVDQKSLEAHPNHKKWLGLLEKFDPDEVVSTANFPATFLDKIEKSILTHAEIFQYNLGAVPLPAIVKAGTHYTTCVENILSLAPGTVLNEYAANASDIFSLWFYAHFGRLGHRVNDFKQANVSISNLTINEADIRKHANDIANGKYLNWNASPLQNSMVYLGARGATDYFDNYNSADIFVFGDSNSDWALFQSLKSIYRDVYWLPGAFFETEKFPTAAAILSGKLFHHGKSVDPIFTSASLSENAIHLLVNAVLSKIGRPSTGHASFQINMEFDSIVTNWLIWGETNNYKNETLFFNGMESIQKAPLLSPKSFKLPPDKLNFQIDVDSNRFCFLANKNCKRTPVRWPNERGSLKTDSKRNITGSVSFYALSHFRFAHDDLDSILRGPRIIKPTIVEDFREIISAIGQKVIESHRTRNIGLVKRLWHDDLIAFKKDYYDQDTKEIFSVFKAGSKVNRRKFGLLATAGIGIQNKFYFSYPISQAFNSPLTTFSDQSLDVWLEQGILERGERLQCSFCGWVDFYREVETRRYFECKRCSGQSNRNIETMGHVEPRIIYGQNSLLYGLQENNSDLVLYGAAKMQESAKNYFEAGFELEIIDAQGKCVQEIDFVANIDGKLYLAEAKSNGKLNGVQLKNYVRLCKSIHANGFVCVSKAKWHPNTEATIKNAFAALRNFDVRFISVE